MQEFINDRLGKFHPKDVDLNTDEPGCRVCGDTGIMPLVGNKCDHKAMNEGELATGREGQEGWVKTKANNAKIIVILIKDGVLWIAEHDDHTFIAENTDLEKLKIIVKSIYPTCVFRYA